jgi:hypothetical protein
MTRALCEGVRPDDPLSLSIGPVLSKLRVDGFVLHDLTDGVRVEKRADLPSAESASAGATSSPSIGSDAPADFSDGAVAEVKLVAPIAASEIPRSSTATAAAAAAAAAAAVDGPPRKYAQLKRFKEPQDLAAMAAAGGGRGRGSRGSKPGGAAHKRQRTEGARGAGGPSGAHRGRAASDWNETSSSDDEDHRGDVLCIRGCGAPHELWTWEDVARFQQLENVTTGSKIDDNSEVEQPAAVPAAELRWIKTTPGAGETWMGLVRLPGTDPLTGGPYRVRHLDIKSWPRAFWSYALIHFTGSDYLVSCGIVGG